MPAYLYTAWFRDETAGADDEDREWPAYFVVEASAAAEAHVWGDHLAVGFCRRRGTERLLRSGVESADGPDARAGLPVVPLAYEATDAEIGW